MSLSNSPRNDYSSSCDSQKPEILDMRQEVDHKTTEKRFTSYSIDRLVDKRSGWDIKVNENNPNEWIKFSVENILKPTFGVKCHRVPIFQPKEKSRTGIRRSLDVPRINIEDDRNRRHSADSLKNEKDLKSADGKICETPKELWPAWIYCTRYSDRPSSGPRSRRSKKKEKKPEDKRPRTAFSGEQLNRLKYEFNENKYLTERRRQDLAKELKLNETQIKIWFQNKRAKLKKLKNEKNPLALQLMAQGLYNHKTVGSDEEDNFEDTSRNSIVE